MKDVHDYLFEVLEEFDRFCTKHEIVYWLDFGSLLGAVRGKDFIPWDDDLDVGMEQLDFDRFTELWDKEDHSESVALRDRTTRPAWASLIPDAKVIHTAAAGYLENSRGRFYQPVALDIFVFRPVRLPRSRTFFGRLYSPVVTAWGVAASGYQWESGWHRIAGRVLSLMPRKLMWTLDQFVQGVWRSESSDLLAPSVALSYTSHYVDRSTVFPLAEAEIRGKRFPAPGDSGAILGSLYGNYLELPPVEKRYTHLDGIEVL